MKSIGKIKVIVVERSRMSFLRKAVELYFDRLSHYTNLEWIEVKSVRHTKGMETDTILKKEASLIRKRIGPRDYVIVLDRNGKSYSSEAFASHLQELFGLGRPISFLVGGPLGLDRELLNIANEKISLSPMTLTHEWSRALLLEQLYRAFTIIRGENYHK